MDGLKALLPIISIGLTGPLAAIVLAVISFSKSENPVWLSLISFCIPLAFGLIFFIHRMGPL